MGVAEMRDVMSDHTLGFIDDKLRFIPDISNAGECSRSRAMHYLPNQLFDKSYQALLAHSAP
jgi:hypothetical protein